MCIRDSTAFASEFGLGNTQAARLVNMGVIKVVEPPLGEVAGVRKTNTWVHHGRSAAAVRSYLAAKRSQSRPSATGG